MVGNCGKCCETAGNRAQRKAMKCNRRTQSRSIEPNEGGVEPSEDCVEPDEDCIEFNDSPRRVRWKRMALAVVGQSYWARAQS
jgi:hypothetical protein